MLTISGKDQKIDIPGTAMSDDEYALSAQSGDSCAEDYLFKKYADMVYLISRPYFLQGAETEDILQEGRIGLFEAIHSFVPERGCSFKSFARICISRQIITAIKSYSRQKHIPLNASLSFQNMQASEDDPEQYFDPEDYITPALDDRLILKETLLSIDSFIARALSPFEKDVFAAFVDGKSYQMIAKELNKPIKSIDGTLQRVRRKLKTYFQEED